MKLLVLADDLTGALEAGGILAGLGTRCLVTLEPTLAPADLDGADDALVIDTETRHLPRAEAFECIRRLAAGACARGVPCVFNKTDSTLRGNIGAELGGVLAAIDGPLVFIPAYPAQGRACRGGRLFVGGRPLAETEFADGGSSSAVADVVRAHCDLPVQLVADARCLQPALAEAPAGTVLICDAQTDDDLSAYGRVLTGEGRALAAGPSDVIRHLCAAPARPSVPQLSARTSLTVVGSMSSVSLAQAGAGGLPTVHLAPDDLLADGGGADRVAAAVRQHGHAAVATVTDREQVADYVAFGGSLGLTEDQVRRRVRTGLARIARSVVEAGIAEALIVFGGDTLHAVAQECGARSFRPVGEALPGVPVAGCRMRGRALVLVSKAGGFGPPDVLARILDRLAPA